MVQWLEELSDAMTGEEAENLYIWMVKSRLGLTSDPNPLLKLYENGNFLAGIYLENFSGNNDYSASGSAENWVEIIKSNEVAKLLSPHAETNAEAMKLLMMIALADQPEAGFEEIHKWMERAAEAGDVEGQYWALHSAIMRPEEAVKSGKNAQYWLKKISESGNHCNYTRIGGFYEKKSVGASLGNHVAANIAGDENLQEAIHWYRRGADNGDAYSMFQLARLYERGRGVPVDYAEARRWYVRADEKGHEESRLRLALYYGPDEPGPEADHSKTLAHYTRLAKAGDQDARFILGTAYSGLYEGYQENEAGAVILLENAYAAGNVRAALILGKMYVSKFVLSGRYDDLSTDNAKLAEKWLIVAIDGGDREALRELKMMSDMIAVRKANR